MYYNSNKTKTDENKSGVGIERMTLRRVFGPKKNDLGEFEIRKIEEFARRVHGRTRWVGRVWRSEGVGTAGEHYNMETERKTTQKTAVGC